MGKKRAAQNAFRHGLNIAVNRDVVLSPDVQALARRIAGEGAGAALQDLACRIAEAQIDLQRVRAHRHRLITRAPSISLRPVDLEASEDPLELAAVLCELTRELTSLDRYERRALSQRKFAIRNFDAARAGMAAA
jgi:hypothetical protein